MLRDINTENRWHYMLKNPDTANVYECFLIKAVMTATPVELRELEKFMPALVSAERARREEEYYGGDYGTSYRPEDIDEDYDLP